MRLRLVGNTNRRELLITLGVWGVLLVGAITGLLLLRAKAADIINHIYYVNVSRGSKATVLYAEAEKHARVVMTKFDALNAAAPQKVPVPQDDENLQQALALYEEAMYTDVQPIFSSERTTHYELLAQLHEASGNPVQQRLAHARALFTAGDDATAMKYIQEARQVDPTAPEPLVLLAQASIRANDLPTAISAIDEVYTSATVTAEARQVKAEIVSRQGRSSEAVEEMQLALAESPKNLDYRLQLARHLMQIDAPAEAAKVMQDGLADGGWLDPAYLHRYGGYLNEIEDLDEAIRVLEQADRLAPYSGDVQFDLAKLYNKAGRKGQSASALRRATEINPELQDRLFED